MQEVFVSGVSLPEAYHRALLALNERGLISPCPDYDTRQKEISLTMSVEKPLAEPMISRLFIGGYRELEQYRQEMLEGVLDFEIERGNWAYTYHSRMKEQLPWLLGELRRNPYSRRAVIDIREWRHDTEEGNDSPACLQHIQYLVREGALHCKTLFRSNDGVKATFMNAFALIMLQERISRELGVKMGSYTHRANSFHCYERDFDLLSGYASRIASAGSLCADEITYEYDGDWKELMEESRPGIAEQIERLKQGG